MQNLVLKTAARSSTTVDPSDTKPNARQGRWVFSRPNFGILEAARTTIYQETKLIMRLNTLILLIFSFLVTATSVQAAGLFEDTEARKAIIDLRQKVQQLEGRITQSGEVSTQATTEISKKIDLLPNAQSLLELSNQNDQLRDQLARLLGRLEELTRETELLRERMQAIDKRVVKLEPTTVTLDGETFTVGLNEKAAYDQAMAALRASDFAKAESYLRQFDDQFPQSGYRPTVLFWLGNAAYATGRYEDALSAFSNLLLTFPTHGRVPEAMLASANCQFELQQKDAAIATLSALVAGHPKSQAAEAAKQRLEALK
jgi:tol-pal system protein YbgF